MTDILDLVARSATDRIKGLEAEVSRQRVELEKHRQVALQHIIDSEQLRNVLDEVWEYMDARADVSDRTDDDGTPYPNAEMQLLSEINGVLGRR